MCVCVHPGIQCIAECAYSRVCVRLIRPICMLFNEPWTAVPGQDEQLFPDWSVTWWWTRRYGVVVGVCVCGGGSTGCFSTWETHYPPLTSRTATYLSHPPSVCPSPALFSILWVRLFEHAATVQKLAVIRDRLRGRITCCYYYCYYRALAGSSRHASRTRIHQAAARRMSAPVTALLLYLAEAAFPIKIRKLK